MTTVRLVLLSDTHGLHRDLPPLPPGDILIHAGDYLRTGRYKNEYHDFIDWMADQPHEHKLFIAGNHDLLMEDGVLAHGGKMTPDDYRARKYCEPIYLLDGSYHAYGLKFYGAPWTPLFQNWAFMSPRGAAMRAHWDLIPPDTDILITHGGPQGILDSLPAYGENLGCADLREAVLRIQPRLHVFGHIHFGYGEAMLGDTRCLNVAQLDDAYRITHAAVVVDLELDAEEKGTMTV